MAKQINQPYSGEDFVRLALVEFPQLHEEFAFEEGLLHNQMHAFTRLMQRAKGAGDWPTYKRGVHLAAELWKRPAEDLHNALNVSFLEHLDFHGERGASAWACLTTELQRGWQAMQAYNAALAARSAPPRKVRRKHSA